MSRRRYFEEQRSGNGAIYHCVEIDTDHDNRFEVFEVIEKRSNAIFIKFNPTPAPSEQHGIIYRFQINNKKYVFMFCNNYDGKSDLIQNADEDVDCMTYAQDTSLYSNDSFFVFV